MPRPLFLVIAALASSTAVSCASHERPFDEADRACPRHDSEPSRAFVMEAPPRPSEVMLTIRTKDQEVAVFRRAHALRFMVAGQTRSLAQAEFARAFPKLHQHFQDALAENEHAMLLSL